MLNARASESPLSPVLRALRFSRPDRDGLTKVAEKCWPALLHLTDRAQLTLPLALRCRDFVPAVASDRLEISLARNAIRYTRLIEAHATVAAALHSRGVEFALLKGLCQSPWYNDSPSHRPQYDIDIYTPHDSLGPAWNAMEALGYKPAGPKDPRADHLPVMIRKTGWKWRGDYYDPEMPVSIELHYRFWDRLTEGFGIPGLDQFWDRRTIREFAGLQLPALHPVDGLSYSALHLIRHLLRGDLRPGHVYQLAHFLHRSAVNPGFWKEWENSGLRSCRVVEGIVFRLATEWFGCDLNPAARHAMEQLPLSIKSWFDLFAFSPVLEKSNKDELWLHLCLVDNRADCRRIAFGRLFPKIRTRVVAAAHVPSAQAGLHIHLQRFLFEAGFLTKRALHHITALMPALRSGFRWWQALADSQSHPSS